MKFRHAMTWLHTWSGLLPGWLLYLIFITGSAGYFDMEITRWMQPEVPVQRGPFNAEALIPKAEQRLQQAAPYADHTYIELPHGRNPYFTLWRHNPETTAANNSGTDHQSSSIAPGWHQEILDPNNGEVIATRETGGGEFLYRLHYALHYIPHDFAFWLTSLAAMFMLVAVITGIVIHRRIFKDFFTFRREKTQTSWLDLHNLLGVLPIPFYLMITYSGLILLMFSSMLPVPVSSYGYDREKLRQVYDNVYGEAAHREAAGIPAESIPLLTFYERATAQHSSESIAFFSIENPGDLHAVVEVATVAQTGLESFAISHYQAVNGEPYLEEAHGNFDSSALAFYEVMETLHEGEFAPPLLRWIYFISGLMGAGMIATGSIFWAVKRRHSHDKADIDSRGLRTVEALNIGTIIGLPMAIAAYFWANRLLPIDLENRADWEAHSLFIVWGLALVHPFLRLGKTGLRRVWAEQLYVTSALYLLLPVVNAATSNNHLFSTLQYGDWVLAGFDLFMLAVAGCGAGAATRVLNPERKPVTTAVLKGVKQ